MQQLATGGRRRRPWRLGAGGGFGNAGRRQRSGETWRKEKPGRRPPGSRRLVVIARMSFLQGSSVLERRTTGMPLGPLAPGLEEGEHALLQHPAPGPKGAVAWASGPQDPAVVR